MKLTVTKFGNPILRQVARRLSPEEILDPKNQRLITAMQKENAIRSYGVGVAAPQFGHSVAVCIIGIKPTPTRPNLPVTELVLINPEIIETYGSRTGMWEGCWSFGDHDHDSPYAKALRYKKIRLRYFDREAQEQEEVFEGFVAHVIQHETDHLNGILFVDRVRDTKTYIMASEYIKMRQAEQSRRKGK